MSASIVRGRVFAAPAGADVESMEGWTEVGAIGFCPGADRPSSHEEPRNLRIDTITGITLTNVHLSPSVRDLLFGDRYPRAKPPYKGLREAMARAGNYPNEDEQLLTWLSTETAGQAHARALLNLPSLPVTTVYGKPTGCFGCDKTKAKLDAAGVPFEWVDVTQNMAALAAIRELGYQQVPVVVTTRPDGRDEHWSGLQPARIDTIITRWKAATA